MTSVQEIRRELEARGWEILDAGVYQSGPNVAVKLDANRHALMGTAMGPWGFDIWTGDGVVDEGEPVQAFDSDLPDDAPAAEVAAWFDTMARAHMAETIGGSSEQ